MTGFYEEAYNRYRNLLTLDPDNSNILFHCGASCLNIPGSEERAITYLKNSVAGVTTDYRERSHKEPGAPVLAYYMLGRAYHLHNEFGKAVENYQKYLEMGVDEDPVQREYVQLQIDACARAEKVVGTPARFEFYDVLDQFDEDLPSCTRPVISGDGTILIFLVDYPSDRKIMMSTREGNVWTRPRVINSEIGMVGETYPACLSYDGKDLYLVHHYYSHSDIFLSHYEDGQWTSAEELGSSVNGRTSENHASISRDGETLYFTSDARGGQGSFDIYVTRKDARGEWGTPRNLGRAINTPYEEHTPFISANDSVLFFSSQGHASIGGIDVFYSLLKEDGSWGEPVNIGHPVNSTGDDIFFNPGWDEQEGYYAVRRENDPTSNTINMVIELEPEEAEIVVASESGDMSASAPASAPASEPGSELEPEPGSEQDPEPGSEPEPSVERVIEPPVTDQIEEVLNRPAGQPDPEVESPGSAAAATGSAAAAGASAAAAPGPRREALYTSIPFEENSHKLNMTATLEAEKIAAIMNTYPGTCIELTGRADARGSSEHNLFLSIQRAGEVALYLEQKGVDPGRITLEGRGEHSPVARDNYPDGRDAPLGRYLNRQVYAKLSGDLPAGADLAGIYIPQELRREDILEGAEEDPAAVLSVFTIQIRAAVEPVPESELGGLTGVREHVGTDGYYRYSVGEHSTYREALDRLDALRNMGFRDAFLRTLDWYERASR